jgi:hypothetical protein
VTDNITKRRSPYNTEPSETTSPRVPETSIAAFEGQDPEIKARRERQVFEFIKTNAGATCYEVVVGLGLLPQSASPAITKLRKAGQLVDTGKRRPTSTGCMAIVWGVVQ